MLVPVEKTITITPEAPVKLPYVSLKLSLALKLKGTLEIASGPKGTDSSGVTPAGYSDGLVERLGHSWYDKEGVKVFGVDTDASECKIEGQAKVKDGLEVSISGTLKYNSGEELKLKFTVAKVGEDWKVTAGQLEFNYTFKSFEIKGYVFENGTLKGAVQAVAVVKADPDYVAIGEAIGQAGTQVVSGVRALVAAISFDTFITFGFVANGILIVVGGIHAMVKGAEIRELPGKVDATTGPLVDGFTAGIQGESANPGGAIGQAGFDKGKEAFGQLRQQMLAKVADASDDEMREAIRSELPKYKGAIYDMMHALAQQSVWEAWASQQTGWLDEKKDLKWGWSAIFGKLPSDSDPEYAKYYNS